MLRRRIISLLLVVLYAALGGVKFAYADSYKSRSSQTVIQPEAAIHDYNIAPVFRLITSAGNDLESEVKTKFGACSFPGQPDLSLTRTAEESFFARPTIWRQSFLSTLLFPFHSFF